MKNISDQEARMRYSGYVVYAILFCCAIISCGKKCTEPAPSLVYFNSFESAEDATGWEGITEEMFVDDPAPGGGERSLYIGGECIQPAAYIDLPPQTDDGTYSISCWGKATELPQTGEVVLVIADAGGPSLGIQMEVDSEGWKFYESEGSLHCRADRRLRLEMWIGGLVPAYMFIDCIKVEKVN
jgi:hypothetical protein